VMIDLLLVSEQIVQPQGGVLHRQMILPDFCAESCAQAACVKILGYKQTKLIDSTRT